MAYTLPLDGDVEEEEDADEDENEKEPGPAVKLVLAIWEHAQVDALNELLQERGLATLPSMRWHRLLLLAQLRRATHVASPHLAAIARPVHSLRH